MILTKKYFYGFFTVFSVVKLQSYEISRKRIYDIFVAIPCTELGLRMILMK